MLFFKRENILILCKQQSSTTIHSPSRRESYRAHKGVRGHHHRPGGVDCCRVSGSQQRQIKEDFLEHATSQLGLKRLAKMSLSAEMQRMGRNEMVFQEEQTV